MVHRFKCYPLHQFNHSKCSRYFNITILDIHITLLVCFMHKLFNVLIRNEEYTSKIRTLFKHNEGIENFPCF